MLQDNDRKHTNNIICKKKKKKKKELSVYAWDPSWGMTLYIKYTIYLKLKYADELRGFFFFLNDVKFIFIRVLTAATGDVWEVIAAKAGSNS